MSKQRVVQITKEEFEAALPLDKKGEPMWRHLGLINNEHQYALDVWVRGKTGKTIRTNKRIVVRSSIDGTGRSAPAGEDSIRMWVEYYYRDEWRPLTRTKARWTCRTKNWKSNLRARLAELWKVAKDDHNQLHQRGGEVSDVRNDDFNQRWTEHKDEFARRERAQEEEAFRHKMDDRADMDAEAVTYCPKCQSVMVLRTRRSDGNKFWGCSKFPECRGTRDYVAVPSIQDAKSAAAEPVKAFEPTDEQLAIFEYIQRRDGTDLVVEALAGTGKTTTIVESLKYTRGKVLFCAFNKRIAVELGKRAPKHVNCATLHSVGFQCLNSQLPSKPMVDNRKKWGIARELIPGDDMPERSAQRALCQLASLVQATLTDPTDEQAVKELIDYYGVDLNGVADKVLAQLPTMLRLCMDRVTVVDFDDMIWLPLVLGLSAEKHDWVFVDEAQDLNRSQLELVKKLVNDHGRIVCVGDRHQSIYAFRGADAEAIPRLIDELNEVEVLPLTISWRCPTSVVDRARRLVPQFRAAPGAIPGDVVEGYSSMRLHQDVAEGDLILCRINAPLVSTCYSLIRAGKKATIIGRDIGKGLIALIDKLGPYSVEDLLTKLYEYRAAELRKLEAQGKEHQAEALSDKCDTLSAMTDGINDLTTLRAKIDQIFTDKVSGISLSSVHRAKGLEAEVVYILKPELMPFPKADKDWELQQEANILYVAITRAKQRLVFIDGYQSSWTGPDELDADTTS